MEESEALERCQENIRKIDEHNEKRKKNLVTFDLGLNIFSAFSDEKIQSINGFQVVNLWPRSFSQGEIDDVVMPPSLNYTAQGWVTGVRNQVSRKYIFSNSN